MDSSFFYFACACDVFETHSVLCSFVCICFCRICYFFMVEYICVLSSISCHVWTLFNVYNVYVYVYVCRLYGVLLLDESLFFFFKYIDWFLCSAWLYLRWKYIDLLTQFFSEKARFCSIHITYKPQIALKKWQKCNRNVYTWKCLYQAINTSQKFTRSRACSELQTSILYVRFSY